MPTPILSGLIASIYRDARLCDCTNSGLSSDVKQITILGTAPIFEANADAPAFIVRTIRGTTHRALYPADPRTGEPLPGRFMFGGNFAYSSDSRFPAEYPLPIHDRQESHFTPRPSYE